MKRWWALGLLISLTAVAKPDDPRGWSKGTKAAGAARILQGPDQKQKLELEFPASLTKKMGKKTLLFYFSPTCPHCQAVAKEFGDLARALPGVTVIGVASASSLPGDLVDFKKAFGIDFEIVLDLDRSIQTAMGVRSTPSVLLVERSTKKKHTLVDVWYPYQPGFDTYVKMRVYADPWKAFDGSYLGNGSCGACHTQEMESWALSHHSIAWRTLVVSEDQKDPECTSCHVTGAGKPTGWTGPDTPQLTAVGCEACHGPSGPHDGKTTDPRTQCAGCHDPKHSIQFSVEKGLPLIDHYSTVALDDEAFRARRMALVDGEAPHELLAFAAEPTVGAEACASCHPAETAQWSAHPHHNAMASLSETERKDPACVKCHATAPEGGPFSTELSGYRVDEGVGCEACHGPGGAHIAAKGGTDNIEGLGEDCPVCVIESVCTTCHVPKWDKDWELEGHLRRVHHTKSPAKPK